MTALLSFAPLLERFFTQRLIQRRPVITDPGGVAGLLVGRRLDLDADSHPVDDVAAGFSRIWLQDILRGRLERRGRETPAEIDALARALIAL